MTRQRTYWKPVVALLLLAPVVGELLSGSAPPAEFITGYPFLILLYGLGALLCRELTVRWDKGWPTLFLLGAAYGVLEEGIVIASFFNIGHADLGVLKGYDRWLGINWVWMLSLTTFHALISVGLSVLLVQTMFAGRAREAWLSHKGFHRAGIVFALSCVLLTILFLWGMLHYMPPAFPYVLSFPLMGLLAWMARRAPETFARSEAEGTRPVHPYLYFLVGFGGCVAWLILHFALPASRVPAPLVFALAVGALAVGTWLLRTMGRGARLEWRHELALGAGAALFWSLMAMIQETDPNRTDNTAGMAIVGLLMMTFVVILWLHRRRFARTNAPALAGIRA